MDPDYELVPRIGTFCILVGCGLFVFFLASAFSGATNFNYFFLGAGLISLGLVFRRRREPPPPSGRFRIIHQARQRRKERRLRQKEKEKK